MWKMGPMSGFDICLVFTLPPRDSTLQYKRYTSEITFLALQPCLILSFSFCTCKSLYLVIIVKRSFATFHDIRKTENNFLLHFLIPRVKFRLQPNFSLDNLSKLLVLKIFWKPTPKCFIVQEFCLFLIHSGL